MRVLALVTRIIKQFGRDKRTLALMLVAPIFVLTLMSLVFESNEYKPKIGLVNLPPQLSGIFEDSDAKIMEYSLSNAKEKLKNGDIDAYIFVEDNRLNVKLEGSDPNSNSAVMKVLQDSFKNTSKEQTFAPKVTTLYGNQDMGTFDFIGPVLIGFFIFFFVFLISGVSFLRERTRGTLERLLSTPLKRWEIVVGYVIGYGIFTSFQAALISWYAIEVLDMIMVGSMWYVMLMTLLLAMTALTLGTFLSAFANNELQMIQFIPIVIVPQVFFSGLFNLSTMDEWLQKFSVILPLKYGADALRDVMIRGKGWESIQNSVFILLGFSMIFMIANVIALKKHRKL
ncbi:MAG: putative transporter permease [Bacillales bacterium]|jgi:ABC-2 type transport system permease protein|nr:putative transporter permease [Bacillales bacterium]